MNINSTLKTIGIMVLLFCIMVCPLFVGIQSISAETKDINIKTTANGIIFNTENLKPGDWIPRDITIMNDGNQAFRYIAKVGKSTSTKGLLDELKLLVKQESKTLFEGKLKDFNGFAPRELSKGSSESLFFEVKIPTYLDNSYQGAKAEVEIQFIAEAVKDAAAPIENPSSNETINGSTLAPKMVNKLPDTSTNHYNALLFGGVLTMLGAVLLFRYPKKFRYYFFD